MGNGRSIRVWQDKWVPQPSTFKLISSPDGVPTDAKVRSLIDPLTGTWHMDMIKQAFSTDDAARILSIPLSSRQLEDCLIWAFTPKGNFTVRSAYKVALSAVSSPNAGTSDGHNCKSIWKSLWHLSVPNKIKSFA